MNAHFPRLNPDFFRIPSQIDESDLFRKMIIWSLWAHVAVVLFFGLKAALFPREALDLDAAIRVDLVGLPDKITEVPQKPLPQLQPAAPAKPAPQAKAEPVKPKPVVLNPSKKKTLEKIKRLEREEQTSKTLENIENEVAKEERQEKLNKLLKGNAVSPGSALQGLNKSEFNEYLGELQNHVQQHWNLPEWLQNDTLKATVVVYIDFRGVVLRRVMEKSSGDTRFDSYALKAVDDASPFPKPPTKFVDVVKVDGIVLRFPQ